MATGALLTRSYLGQLVAGNQVSEQTARVLEASGAREPEMILSLLQAFPSLSKTGLVNSPALSNVVMKTAGSAAVNAVLATAASGGPFGGLRRTTSAPGYGAKEPPTARWKPSQSVPVPAAPSQAAAAPMSNVSIAGARQIDTRGCLPWPVRDQGQRGTCVAFGTAALRELLMCEQSDGLQDTSEQFLYWDIKTNSSDPQKTTDGTWIEYAFQSLGQAGICTEAVWPYNPFPTPTNVSQGGPNAPPAGSAQQAAQWAYQAAVHNHVTATSGNAQVIFNLLSNHRPVAISLPVFSDPLNPQSDNWSTSAGWLWGRVLDPPPTSVVIGGHCVCVTGFEPDATEPLGGYFIIRNSWSPQWGAQLPLAGHYGPEAGYGQVSASYVDQYLWEYGQL